MSTDWTPARIEALRREWSAPDKPSAAEIGRRIGATKNSVVGKAHRLHLEPRPSPICPGTAKPRPAPRAAKTTLPDLFSAPGAVAELDAHDTADLPPVGNLFPMFHIPPRVQSEPLRLDAPKLGNAECVFPEGDPGTPGFKFCGKRAVIGRPYCPACCARAYVCVGAVSTDERVYLVGRGV